MERWREDLLLARIGSKIWQKESRVNAGPIAALAYLLIIINSF